MCDARVARVRELKAQVAALNEELASANEERAALRGLFHLALAAALDARRLPPGARMLVVDGWNALFGTHSILSAEQKREMAIEEKREVLSKRVREWLAAHPEDAAWIVFDGSRLGGREEGRLRVSWTGGEGPHRADNMVCDYLRMGALVGANVRALVVTDDKDFRRRAESLGAKVVGVSHLSAPTGK